MLLPFLLLAMIVQQTTALFEALTFSKQLFIPGGYFSLMNFTRNVSSLEDYYDISINFTLTQTAYGDQGNSIYDLFLFNKNNYQKVEPCYEQAINYLNMLYSQYEPCQGGCSLNSVMTTSEYNLQYNLQQTHLNLSNKSQPNQISLIIDNTFYPCNGGAFQSEVYLYQTMDLTIESNLDFILMLKIVFVVLLQIFIFLFAYIMIMVNKLQNQKKKLKKIKQEKEDSDVIHDYEKENV